jgi:hypothetical protein
MRAILRERYVDIARPRKGPLGSGFYHSLVRMFVRVMVRRRVMIFYTRTWPWPIGIGIRMNIGGAIGEGAAPGNSADDNGVRTPSKARPRPAKGHERRPDKYAGGEVDGETDPDPRSRWSKNHRRAVHRNVEVGRIYRNDFDISPCIDHVIVRVRPQIAIAISLLTHSLDSVHDIRPLRENRIAQRLRPTWVLRHHLQHLGKRQQGQHTGIPRQVILPDRTGQRVAA